MDDFEQTDFEPATEDEISFIKKNYNGDFVRISSFVIGRNL